MLRLHPAGSDQFVFYTDTQRAGDTGNLHGVGEAGTHIPRTLKGKNLGLVLQAPYRRAENNPGVVLLEGVAAIVRRIAFGSRVSQPGGVEEIVPVHRIASLFVFGHYIRLPFSCRPSCAVKPC